jgi:hypothetical protein
MSNRRSVPDKPPDKSGRPEKDYREPSFPIIESSSGSQRRSTSPQHSMDVDIDAILAELPAEWVVEERTHIPLHLRGQCQECISFVRHVVAGTRGGGYSHLVSIQREHWSMVLRDDKDEREFWRREFRDDKNEREFWRREFRDEREEAFHQGWDKAQDKYEARIEELLIELNELRGRYKELQEENVQRRQDVSTHQKRERPVSYDRDVDEKEEPSQTKKTRTEEPVVAVDKGKQKAPQSEEPEQPRRRMGMYDHSSSSDDYSYNGRDDDDINEQLESFRQRERRERDQRAAHPQAHNASSSTAAALPDASPVVGRQTTSRASYKNALIDRIGSGTRAMPPESTFPVPPARHIRPPARFNLQAWRDARVHANGNVSVQKATYWGEDVSKLWLAPLRYWDTGRLAQLVKEASRVPYDQRSYVQRWVVHAATSDGTLPYGTLSAEPDVEDEAVLRQASYTLRVDDHGRFFVEDITVWMFLKMTQPEERERTVKWFWYLSCLLFSKRGQYDEVLRDRGLNGNDEGRFYTPWRFVRAGEWAIEHIAEHFYHCGLRSKQANTIFYEFASLWLGELTTPPEAPNWSQIPTPLALFDRTKAKKAAKTQRRRAQQSSQYYETSSVSLTYDDPQVVGQQTSSASQNATQQGEGQNVDPQVEELMPVDEAEGPQGFEGDNSRM